MERRSGLTLLKLTLLLITAAVALWRLHPQVDEDDTPLRLEALKRHVARVAAVPHPVGSDENRQVRAYIVAALERLGLRPEVRRHDVQNRRGETVAVENILCVIPGVSTGLDVYVVTHYDSAPRAPGAGDAAASVAALLEAARLLVERPPEGVNVVLLMTDGEEAGLLGARAWAEHRPAYPPCDLVLNFDARGTAGPSVMFETSRLSRDLLDAYVAGARQPVTSSLADEVYRRMPNGTDFTVFARAGVPGLNFAFLDGFHRYHTPSDTPGALSDATLLHHAQQVNGVVRSVERLPRPGNKPEVIPLVYFDLLAVGVVRYSAQWAIPFSAASGLLLSIAWWRQRPSLKGTAKAAGIQLLALVTMAAWAQLAIYVLGLAIEPSALKAANAWLWPIFVTIALGVLGVTLGITRLRRLSTPPSRAFAVTAFFALAAITSAAAVPSGSYLFTWPALLLSIALLLPAGRWREAGLLMAAIGATIILLPIAWLITVALTLRLLSAGVAMLALLAWMWAVAIDGGSIYPSSTIPPAVAASPPLVASRKFIRK